MIVYLLFTGQGIYLLLASTIFAILRHSGPWGIVDLTLEVRMLLMLVLGCASQEPPNASQEPPNASQEPPNASQEPPNASQEPPNERLPDLSMKLIPAGTFTMGSPETEKGRGSNEVQHQVTLTRGFYIMEAEVTQALWTAVMGSNPSSFSSCGDSCPVERVSWYDAVDFANRLSDRVGLERCYTVTGESASEVAWPKGLNCKGYRLPTEAEWEYAAKGLYQFVYSGSNSASYVAWYWDNSGEKTQPVCGKKRNGYGLCDMSGNVNEWVWDWRGNYPEGAVEDPKGPLSRNGCGGEETRRVYRGGSWRGDAEDARVAFRGRLHPGRPLRLHPRLPSLEVRPLGRGPPTLRRSSPFFVIRGQTG
jgi:formylglycine-generating enzyme